MNKAVLVGATATTASEYSGVKKKAQRAAESSLTGGLTFFSPYCSYLHTVHWFLGWIRLRYLCWCRNPAEQCAVASLEHTQEVVNFGLCSGNLGQKEGHFLIFMLTEMRLHIHVHKIQIFTSNARPLWSQQLWSQPCSLDRNGTRRCHVKK